MILCGGDALIDFVPVAAPDGGLAFQPRVGGAVLNAATALARLGEAVSFVGALSNDLFGDMLAAHMLREGIGTDHVIRSDDDSTLAFVRLDNGEARYAFYDRTSAGRHWPGATALPQAAALHLGSVTLIAAPSGDAYAALAEALSPHMVISLDPNCRPSLIADRDSYRARIARIAAVSHLIRLSEEDFDYLHPDKDEAIVAETLLTGTPALVLISRGAVGATAYWTGGRLDSPAQSVDVVDTIGAGDVFHAAMLAGLSRRGALTAGGLAGLTRPELEGLLRFATRAAAMNCAAAGCDPPRATDLEEEIHE